MVYKRFVFAFLYSMSLGFGMDFSFCKARYKEVTLAFKDLRAVPILFKDKVYYVAYSKSPIIAKEVIKSDPFIGLYLLDVKQPSRGYELKEIETMPDDIEVAIIGSQKIQKTKILQEQKGFINYAKTSDLIEPNEIVSNICYQIYGIGTKEGFIDKKYLERFLSQDEVYYGDIGVRLKENSNQILQVDPFFANNPFRPGDIIIQINDKKVIAENLQWVIANLNYQSRVKVTILRYEDSKEVQKTFEVEVNKLFGGLLLQDTFFESQGIKIDRNLVVRRISKNLHNGLENLQRGDQILWVNRQNLKKMQGDIFFNLRKTLSEAYSKEGFIELLISRNGLQFTIKIYPNHAKEF